MHKKGDKTVVSDNRPITLLNIVSKVFERCMYGDVNNLFGEAVTKEQHGFVKNRSVLPNILAYLREIHDGLDDNPQANVIYF